MSKSGPKRYYAFKQPWTRAKLQETQRQHAIDAGLARAATGGDLTLGMANLTYDIKHGSVPSGYAEVYQELLDDPQLINFKRLVARDETYLIAFMSDKTDLSKDDLKLLMQFEGTIRQHMVADREATIQATERLNDAARAATLISLANNVFQAGCPNCHKPLDKLFDIFKVGLAYAVQHVNLQELADKVAPFIRPADPNGVVSSAALIEAQLDYNNIRNAAKQAREDV